jgi:hypothetical protein
MPQQAPSASERIEDLKELHRQAILAVSLKEFGVDLARRNKPDGKGIHSR